MLWLFYAACMVKVIHRSYPQVRNTVDNTGQHAERQRKVIHMFALCLTCLVRWIVQPRAARVARRLAILLSLQLCISLAANSAAAIDLLNIRAYAYKVIDNSKEFKCLDYIITKESHWNYKADNPKSSAYGIGQILGETATDPYTQLAKVLRYLAHRYPSICAAQRHHVAKGWY